MAGNSLLNLAGRRPPPSMGEDDPTDLPQMQGPPKGMGAMMAGPPPGEEEPEAPMPPEAEAPEAGIDERGPAKLPTTPEEAIGVMEDFGVAPTDFPLIRAACEILSAEMDAAAEPPQAAPAAEAEAA